MNGDHEVSVVDNRLQAFDAARQSINELAVKCKDIVIVDSDGLAEAKELAVTGRDIKKLIEDKRKEITKPILDRKKQIDDFVKDIVKELDDSLGTLRGQMLAYEKEQERIRQEAIRKAEEEARRKEEELKKQAEEVLKKDDVTDDEVQEIMAKRDELIQAKSDEAALQNQKSKNIRLVWTWELEDLAKVPRKYLEIYQPAVKEAIKAGIREIPGIRIFQEEQLNLR